MNTPTYWIELYPDVKSPIGGVKQAHRLAEAFLAIDRKAVIVQQHSSFHPGWFSSHVDTISYTDWAKLRLDPSDNIVIIPETYLTDSRFSSNPHHDLPYVIFNQNSSYTFGYSNKGKPFNYKLTSVLEHYDHPNLRAVFCVSDYDQTFLLSALNLNFVPCFKLCNPIESEIFSPGRKKHKIVSFFTRKNPTHSQIVYKLLARQPFFKDWKFLPMTNLQQSEVCSVLSKSLVFLDFGFPEGFGLPAAEALASSCYLIGYDGLGGREIYDYAQANGSGCAIPFGDFNAWVESFSKFNSKLSSTSGLSQLSSTLLNASDYILKKYSFSNLCSSLMNACLSIESNC